MKKVKKMKLTTLSQGKINKREMNQIVGGAGGSCITCTPDGNHVDENDYDEEVKLAELSHW
ncbi:TIGR04149 family rSAM-modified RiPP [Proteiniphilum sp.]|uniref:TIGR04149 family rSAM-modified RiPP n=1 Tax=Proteiniphilum sp. TaxID=1926877 RepID=UPI00332166E4